MDVDGFGDLVQQAEQLTAEMDAGGELPRVERNLQQVLEATQRLLAAKTVGSQDSSNVRASVLLGSRGYDMQKISKRLEGLSSTKTFEPLEPVRDTDIQAFLKNERENALLAAIEQTKKNTFEEIECRYWENLENEWEREKQKILNALVGSGGDVLDFPQQQPEDMLQDSVSMHSRSAMDQTEMAYARQVFVYNDHVIQGGILPSLVELFSKVSSGSDDKNLVELWTMVRYMTEVPLAVAGSLVKARTSSRLQTAFIQQALQYLEHSYAKYIEATTNAHLHQAQMGGIPGTFHRVKGFLNIKMPMPMQGLEDGTVEGQPVWPMLYYCIRCGDLQAALQVVRASQHQLGDFSTILQEYSQSEDRRLSYGSETNLRMQYRRAVRNSTDPFKKAVYCVLGRCDPRDDHAEVADKIDDYLWLKLSQVTCEEDDQSDDKLTLTQLQCRLLEYGESHFQAYQQPFLYFRVLFLTAQFEAGIEFLSRIDRVRCHAVHVAMVLHQLKLLLMPHSIQAHMLSPEPGDEEPLRRLNFARLIMMYTRKFEATDPREALLYFYFLREHKTAQGENLFMQCVSELVLETREFEMLLGQLGRDGSRKPGAIDKFASDTQKIIEKVASDTENKGLFEDAVKLYDLGKKYDKVLVLLNNLLTQVLSQPNTPQSNRDRIKNLAASIASRYRAQGNEGARINTSTFYLLLDLMTFFDLYHGSKMEQAHQVIQDLKLVPLTTDAAEQKQKVDAFSHYADEIRRSLPEILLATMNILLSQYRKAKSRGVTHSPLTPRTLARQDGGKESFIQYLRTQARALITFAGMIPYRMPGDTNARLIQMEVLMN